MYAIMLRRWIVFDGKGDRYNNQYNSSLTSPTEGIWCSYSFNQNRFKSLCTGT